MSVSPGITQSLFPTCTLLVVLCLLSGCSSASPVIPREWESQIDSSVSFPDMVAAPSAYQGRTVLLGGEILSAKRLKEGTQLEILQLPVVKDDPPALRRSESQGRFLAYTRSGLDPAAYSPGTRVTVIGEVTGETLLPLDESDYRYPTMDVKHLYVWDAAEYQRRRRASPAVSLFGGMGFGFGGGRSGSFGGLGLGTGF